MAIELDCPHCRGSLRVPDSAMESVINCPRCRKALRVPVVAIPATLAGPAAGSPLAFVDDEPDSPFFAEAESESPAEPINPHAVLARRNKRRMSRGWIGVILAFVLATAGTAGVYWYNNSSQVVRSVQASVIANATLSKDLSALDVDVTTPDWGAILSSLEVNPVEMTDSKMKVKFAASSKGLQLSLTPTGERILVAVPTADIQELQQPSTQAALLDAWKADLSRALTAMSATIQSAVAGGTLPRLDAYGDTVGLEGLAGPVGYHFWAVVGTTAYPCVFEDANHQLYFLVPQGTTSLAVVPRDIGARSTLPQKMRITATVK